MAKLTINVGINANDGTGDDLRTAMQKVNANFTELYGTTAEANDLVEDTSPQLGGNLDVQTYQITTSTANGNINIQPNGSGSILLGSLKVRGTSLSSDDSTQIQINENLNVAGNLIVNTIVSGDSSEILIDDSINVVGNITASGLTINTITSADSSAIQINDALNVSGQIYTPLLNTNIIYSGDSSDIQIGDNISMLGSLSTPSVITNNISSTDSSAVRIDDSLSMAGNIVPAADNTYSLGTSDKKWSEVHVAGSTIYLGTLQIKDSGSNSLSILSADGSTQASIDASVGESLYSIEIDGTTPITGLSGADTIYITPAIGYGGSDTHSLSFTGRDVPGRRTLIINASTLCTVEVDLGSMGGVTANPSTITEVIYTGDGYWWTISSNSI